MLKIIYLAVNCIPNMHFIRSSEYPWLDDRCSIVNVQMIGHKHELHKAILTDREYHCHQNLFLVSSLVELKQVF